MSGRGSAGPLGQPLTLQSIRQLSLVVDFHQLSSRCLAFAIFPAIAPLALSFPAAYLSSLCPRKADGFVVRHAESLDSSAVINAVFATENIHEARSVGSGSAWLGLQHIVGAKSGGEWAKWSRVDRRAGRRGDRGRHRGGGAAHEHDAGGCHRLL